MAHIDDFNIGDLVEFTPEFIKFGRSQYYQDNVFCPDKGGEGAIYIITEIEEYSQNWKIIIITDTRIGPRQDPMKKRHLIVNDRVVWIYARRSKVACITHYKSNKKPHGSHNCPLCGSLGQMMFVQFECSNNNCKNFI